mmetsp:Transcript_55967/g.113950  ORF Transcript_55967/g.113950 Transcript_55967/m.113950 type:complete len:896 (+) Transcript_55967:118-2805(+)
MALSMLMVALENIEPEVAASVAIAGGVLALIVAGLFTYQLKSYNDGSVAFRKEGEWVRPLPSKDAENGQPSAFYVPGCENWSAEQKKNFQFGAPNGKKISDIVQDGARAFLNTEYKWLSAFVAIMFVVICIMLRKDDAELDGLYTGISFLIGAFLSASAGYLGMLIATASNVRTTVACHTSMLRGLNVAFRSGAVMSLCVVGFGLLGLSILQLIFQGDEDILDTKSFDYLSGFGFGASSIALFARVAGGIFTKAADVGADLVGKVDAGIPEDSPNNPAAIADNVGDNVGDVAGMGADLFESYVGSLIAAGSLAANTNDLALAYWVAGFGVLSSLIGITLVMKRNLSNDATLEELLWTIRYGIFLAGFLVIGFSLMCCLLMFESEAAWNRFGCIVVGLVAGIVIGLFTEYCTSYDYQPTIDIDAAAPTGGATVIIKGLGVGMLSVVVPTFAVCIAILACDEFAGQYGIALAAVGMLSTLSITLATDAYGPVADNAGGIAEMSGEEFPEYARDRTDALDALGNTTAATGKGFAIGSAVLTSAGLIAAFTNDAGVTIVDLTAPVVLAGVMIGACMPFVFAALTMLSVGSAAQSIIVEVTRQFRLYPGLRTEEIQAPLKVGDEVLPNHGRCIAICTSSAIKEMLIPGMLAVFAPAVIGFLMGTYGLTGMLVGSLTSGFMLAVSMANAGGAWDNAKKLREKNGKAQVRAAAAMLKAGEISQDVYDAVDHAYHKLHEATVTGDTVGDPFKDTSGPALNILIKLMSVVSLVMAPVLKDLEAPSGFSTDGTLWAAIVFFAALILTLLAMMYFNKVTPAAAPTKDDLELATEAALAMKAAGGPAKGAAGAGVGAGAGVADVDITVDAETKPAPAANGAEAAAEAGAAKAADAAPAADAPVVQES